MRLTRAGVAPRRIAIEQPRHDSGQPVRNVAAHRTHGAGAHPQPRDHRAERRLTRERQLAGQHLEQDDAGGVEIGALVERLAQRLLGRDVVRRTDHASRQRRARGVLVIQPARQAEVGELHRSIGGNQHVLGLDVAMDGLHGVQRLEPDQHLSRDVHGVGGREPSVPRQELAERFAVDQLHGQKNRSAVAAEVEDADEMAAERVARHVHLAAQPRQRRRRDAFGPENLDGDVALQLAVVRAVDGSVSAAAEQRGDLIAAGDDASGLQRLEAAAGRIVRINRFGSRTNVRIQGNTH